MGKTDKKMNITDLAKEIGVSVSTVSRVLSGSSHPVSKELKEKVLTAAKEYNYVPNLIGRQLKTQSSTDIAIVIPTLMNPFFPEILEGVERYVSKKKKYNTIIYNTYGDTDKEIEYLRNIRQRQITGVLISTTYNNVNASLFDELKDLQNSGVNIVAFDQEIDGLDTSSVTFDVEKAGEIAIEHLSGLGHRKIAIANSPLIRRSRVKMFESFKSALRKFDIEFNEDYAITPIDESELTDLMMTRYEFENGKYQTEKLMSMDNPPTAIFATNDLTAYGILQALSDMGIRVPEDVSVMGYNNLFYSSMMNPRLTTIEQPMNVMGEESVRLLIEGMENKRDYCKAIKLNPSLVIRDSTGPAR